MSRSYGARARVLERQDVREAVRIAAPMCLIVVAISGVVVGINSPAKLVLIVTAIGALSAITWLSMRRVRRRPHLLALALAIVVLVGRIIPLQFSLGTAELAEGYFALVVVGSAMFLPWSMRWHLTWVTIASVVYLTATLTMPRLTGHGATEYLFAMTAVTASIAGQVVVRRRRARQLVVHMALRDERIRLRRAHARLQEAAIEDPLTGLLNRRRLSEDVAFLESQFARDRRSLSALMVDLDAFKEYNDALGHQAGDRALLRTATAVRQAVRTVDHVYRYGGEELLVLLSEGDIEAAQIVAERIVAAVRGLRIPHPGTPGGWLTVSVGSAATSGRTISPWEVIGEADRALYLAKASGRDRAIPTRTTLPVHVHPLAGVGTAA